MQHAAHQAASQQRICADVTQRHTLRTMRHGLRFKAADRTPQGRKRTHARTGHAPLLEFFGFITRFNRTNDDLICS
jgi:hypothetical protein